MSKSIHVTMPDGSVWSVPAHLVAEPRARYYAEIDSNGADEGPEFDRAYADELEPGDDALIDWAQNNMNWSDVEKSAVRIGGPPPSDYQDGWVNGPMRVVDE